MLAYVLDDALRRQINAQGRNHWDVYLQEICNQLGVTASALSLEDVQRPDALRSLRTLILGSQSAAALSQHATAALRAWVHQGGLLIGFAPPAALDDLFGVRTEATMPQPQDDYTIAAHLQFMPHSLVREVHPYMHIEQMLLAISPVRLADRMDGHELARLHDTLGNDLERPAIVWRRCGAGTAGWFAFDVAQTIWLLHQGRPLPSLPPGAFAQRTPQMSVIGPNSCKIAYADELVHVLQNMIATTGQPFIYPIPPFEPQSDKGDVIPDALLYYTGDEYTGPVEWSLGASDFMKSRGLPYHINITAHQHPMTPAQCEHLRRNGHEVSNYICVRTADRNGSQLNLEHFQMQTRALRERFNLQTGAVLVGSCQWQGWTEPARWLAQAGAKADNTFVGWKVAPVGTHQASVSQYHNVWFNGPGFGFAFGTSFPFFFYDDAEHDNRRIDLQEQPLICYELGHRASNLVDLQSQTREDETFAPEDLHEPIDRAVRYHLVMNVFYHPYYIVNFPHCRAAIDAMLRYIAYKQAHVLHMANNAVADWWAARARATLIDITFAPTCLQFTARVDWPAGMIIRLRWDASTPVHVTSADKPLPHCIRREFGDDWLYVIVPSGQHPIVVSKDG
jgi:hypothetical protein